MVTKVRKIPDFFKKSGIIMVRVFITDLDFMAVMHRFLIFFTKTGAGER